MSGLGMTWKDVLYLRGNDRVIIDSRLDFVDCDCILKKNVCVKGISLKDWSAATIYADGEVFDRVKTQGLILFNFPRMDAGTIVKVVTDPPTEWALIMLLDVFPQGMFDDKKLDFYTPLSEVED